MLQKVTCRQRELSYVKVTMPKNRINSLKATLRRGLLKMSCQMTTFLKMGSDTAHLKKKKSIASINAEIRHTNCFEIQFQNIYIGIIQADKAVNIKICITLLTVETTYTEALKKTNQQKNSRMRKVLS